MVSSEISSRQPTMSFWAVASALVLAVPLLLTTRSGEWLLRGAGPNVAGQPQPVSGDPQYGASGNGSVAGDEGAEVRAEWSSTSASTGSTTGCPECACEPSLLASPPSGTFMARILYRATYAGDFEVNVLVWISLALYGAAAASCGWAWRGCSSGAGAGTLASQRVRPRGAGYRAGLSAPRELR